MERNRRYRAADPASIYRCGNLLSKHAAGLGTGVNKVLFNLRTK